MRGETTHRLGVSALTAVLIATALGGSRASVSSGPGPIARCDGADAIDFACYQRRYREMVAVRGPRPAIRDLNEHALRSGYVRAACHQLMHGIGRDSGRTLGLRAFDRGDETCSSGFFHGVVEAVMARIGSGRVVAQAERVCAPFRARGAHGIANYNCVHGMGHGFMDVFSGDVFRALDGCAALPDSWERHHCEGGVFMENLTSMSQPARRAHHLRPEQPLYPCTAVAARYKHECYMKQTAYALFVRDNDFQAVFRMCAASPDVGFRDDCEQGLGGDASIRASKYVTDPAARRSTVRALCGLGRDRAARRNCVIGAVTGIVRDGASHAANPGALCASFAEADLRGACARAHLETVRQLTSEPAPRQDPVDTGGHSPELLCRNAARIEAASARAPIPQDDRGGLQ
ncbi:MAG: hypothetical protein QOJ12_1670 [Thermoleophilales bacterium]|nr:hypothetical protein [Thermoleophilales bacterium]